MSRKTTLLNIQTDISRHITNYPMDSKKIIRMCTDKVIILEEVIQDILHDIIEQDKQMVKDIEGFKEIPTKKIVKKVKK